MRSCILQMMGESARVSLSARGGGMAVEYRHSSEYMDFKWETGAERFTRADPGHVVDLDGHMKAWADSGWTLHTLSTVNRGEVSRGFRMWYTFIWQREAQVPSLDLS